MAFHLFTGFMLQTTPSVWVVDDDEDDRIFIQSAFSDTEKPIDVLTLNDGDQLLPELATCDKLPRLILLDINMSRQNGFDTLTQIRSTSAFAHLPVVIMSTSSDKSDLQRSLALGADQFLIKPTSYNQLVSLVKGLTEKWELA
ncbi:response regulator [Spirosoma koreense]